MDIYTSPIFLQHPDAAGVMRKWKRRKPVWTWLRNTGIFIISVFVGAAIPGAIRQSYPFDSVPNFALYLVPIAIGLGLMLFARAIKGDTDAERRRIVRRIDALADALVFPNLEMISEMAIHDIQAQGQDVLLIERRILDRFQHEFLQDYPKLKHINMMTFLRKGLDEYREEKEGDMIALIRLMKEFNLLTDEWITESLPGFLRKIREEDR